MDCELTALQARPFLPPVAKCRIARDDTLHKRWKVMYPNPAPGPYMTSQAFGVSSCKRALWFCICWAWDQHSKAPGGSPNPFKFEDL